jgi:hypothetical protein
LINDRASKSSSRLDSKQGGPVDRRRALGEPLPVAEISSEAAGRARPAQGCDPAALPKKRRDMLRFWDVTGLASRGEDEETIKESDAQAPAAGNSN